MVKKQALVVCGLLFRGKKLLVGKRPLTKSFLPGCFELPGGHVEPGESPELALHREFFEELGVKVRVLAEVYRFSYVSARVDVEERDFLVEQADSASLCALDHDELRWVEAGELDSLLISEDEKNAMLAGFAFIAKK